ncbi:RING-H2 finger protein ATL52 [Hordeum vulgare]|uniref:RING-type E3 ubiquitin transferase n=1 Tax=Hordeum vulgare subsp. vulgare TaxID=112509 RepID=F2CXH3_HORVV|nr:RING-H2 finger protein ATL52-like [Hordeum vulgare subsp. vulgare]KAE8788287.1 RING-H2 finger protein ATL52 [Hordeum vulgare]KAI5014958.1 hypothetical protein ZWY2020_056348 [Hordeum vulgare]BAJ87544.1 predicted protein [Hordeum vulgare subsp. vulgare]
MPRHYRRILFSDDCDPWYGCPPPPAPPFFTPSPSPSPSSPPPITSPSPPSPSFSFYIPTISDLAPCPSPVHAGGGGGRDQGGGTYGYGAVDDHRRRFVTYVLSAAAALAFLSLILLGVSIAVRRRQMRRRRQALLAQAPAAATNVGNDDPEGGGGGGGVVHHVWYIRTVGLDEAAIDSIAVTPYRAGSGLLGAADCSVCLGEFNDGELVRLLPKCGHAFHVPCIDTWLRAHVNCPLCRSDVIDPAAAPAGVGIESNPPADPDASANAAAEQAAAASDSTLEHEDEEEEDQEAPRVEEDQHEQQPSSPEPEPLPQLPGPLPRNVRRAASMNAAMVSTAADVAALDRLPDAAPEGEEQNGRDKHQSGATGHPSTVRPASGGLPRSFFSRHCRARSSVLPL